MKLIKGELKGKVWDDIHDKVIEHVPYGTPVRYQIGKNIGLWGNDDNLFPSKIHNPQWNIRRNLDETD